MQAFISPWVNARGLNLLVHCQRPPVECANITKSAGLRQTTGMG